MAFKNGERVLAIINGTKISGTISKKIERNNENIYVVKLRDGNSQVIVSEEDVSKE